MENITIHLDKTYIDTREHILFAAESYGYQQMIDDPNIPVEEKWKISEKIPNPQTPEDFMFDKLMEVIEDFMTKPIKEYIRQQAIIQAEEQAQQAAEQVLNKIQ